MESLASILAAMQRPQGTMPGAAATLPSGAIPTAGGAFQQMPTGGGVAPGQAAAIAAMLQAAPSSAQAPMGGAPTVRMSQMPVGPTLPGGGGAVPQMGGGVNMQQMPLGLGMLPLR